MVSNKRQDNYYDIFSFIKYKDSVLDPSRNLILFTLNQIRNDSRPIGPPSAGETLSKKRRYLTSKTRFNEDQKSRFKHSKTLRVDISILKD